MNFRVESSFSKGRTMTGYRTHMQALGAYTEQAEAETGWSYPEEAIVEVSLCGRKRDVRQYVVVDGFFERA
ncbi:MAG: hypothetical protein WA975_18045 [Mesorhizobium sp.]